MKNLKTHKQTILLKVVQSWQIDSHPEYREFRCANCQKYMKDGAWHHLLTSGGYITPVHFCDACETDFNKFKIEPPTFKVNLDNLNIELECMQKEHKNLEKIIEAQKKCVTDIYKTFTCDLCGKDLPKDKKYRKGYHVWCKIDGNLVEFHFDKKCFYEAMDIH